ncbi:MAG TPA: ribose 5-phosphate isomerase B [Elusimicrobiota bacterium]|nr:ribose 5-phosphate isomerase B [Elusimicrobiota bacterium]
MKVAIGSDHAGYSKKRDLMPFLLREGHEVLDEGCYDEESCDYPDFARKVTERVRRGVADRGILICGTGIGMAIAANKVPGIRAAVCWNSKTAAAAAEHNMANVLCLGSRMLTLVQMKRLIRLWIETPFGPDRHRRRVGKITAIERSFLCCGKHHKP